MGCTQQQKQQSSKPNLNSTLWALTAAEYEAACLTVYKSAMLQLAQAKADTTWTAALEQKQDLSDPTISSSLLPAVVLDIDETVLSNAPYFARLMSEDEQIARGSFDNWVAEARATALSGVIEYIKEAKRQGIAVIYLTNRACRKRADNDDPCPQRTDTIANLENAGLPPLGPDDLVLLRNQQTGWTGEKSIRRSFICEKYRILQIFGDNLGDFAPKLGASGMTPNQRKEQTRQYQDKWGSKWFMLPNPIYGAWLNALGDDPEAYLK
ncbi:MAG: acid phosphatase [Planctomycetes bacterium]|nr:acid phosphatase [Planctomycetota bacterium]